MGTLILVLAALAGLLFAAKIVYLLCTVSVLPLTMGATYVPTSPIRIFAFLEAVPMTPGQVLIDIGCGDGRVLHQAHKRYGVRGVGYELNPLAYLKARIKFIGCRGVEIRWRNFQNADLSDADVVFCYLFPDVLKTLSSKLLSDLKPGATVVSCNFAIPGFDPEKILRPPGSLHHDPIYIYRLTGTKEQKA
jgi:SAM-dependent methyltransferase